MVAVVCWGSEGGLSVNDKLYGLTTNWPLHSIIFHLAQFCRFSPIPGPHPVKGQCDPPEMEILKASLDSIWFGRKLIPGFTLGSLFWFLFIHCSVSEGMYKRMPWVTPRNKPVE